MRSIADIPNSRPFRPLPSPPPRRSGAALWRQHGGKLSRSDRDYYRVAKAWFNLSDADSQLAADRIETHLNGSWSDRLPDVRAYEISEHRRGRHDLFLMSAPLRRGKRQSLSWCISVSGTDAEAFISLLNRDYCDGRLYHETMPCGAEAAWLRLDFARPVLVRGMGVRTLAGDTERQNTKFEMLHAALDLLAASSACEVKIEVSGQANVVYTEYGRQSPRGHRRLVTRGRHMFLPRCPAPDDVKRWTRSRLPGDVLLAKLSHDVGDWAEDVCDDTSLPWSAYNYLTNQARREYVNLQVTTARQPGQGPLERPFFNLGEDLPAASALVRSRLSRSALAELSRAEAAKLGDVSVTYDMLALALCSYARNAYTVCRRGGQRDAVPAASIRAMLHHFGYTQVDGSHVRVLRQTLESMGLIKGDRVFGRGRCERFQIVGPALYLPFLIDNLAAQADRAARDAECASRTGERLPYLDCQYEEWAHKLSHSNLDLQPLVINVLTSIRVVTQGRYVESFILTSVPASELPV